MGKRCYRQKETAMKVCIRDTVAFSHLEKLSPFILNFAKKEQRYESCHL